MNPCDGPLIWFDAPENAAILECSQCGYVVITGSVNDEAHLATPFLREGMAAR